MSRAAHLHLSPSFGSAAFDACLTPEFLAAIDAATGEMGAPSRRSPEKTMRWVADRMPGPGTTVYLAWERNVPHESSLDRLLFPPALWQQALHESIRRSCSELVDDLPEIVSDDMMRPVNVPFEHRVAAGRAGARWDDIRRMWVCKNSQVEAVEAAIARSAKRAADRKLADQAARQLSEDRARADREAARVEALRVARELDDADPWVQISGSTYPVKGALRDLGARWNDGWSVRQSRAAEARAIVAAVPVQESFDEKCERLLRAAGWEPKGQLWEECGCGREPVYMWAKSGDAAGFLEWGNHICARCMARKLRLI